MSEAEFDQAAREAHEAALAAMHANTAYARAREALPKGEYHTPQYRQYLKLKRAADAAREKAAAASRRHEQALKAVGGVTRFGTQIPQLICA